jgi:hypothetical protein
MSVTLTRIKKVIPLKDGTIITDGTEQTVVEYTRVGRIMGSIDLSNMASGDTVVIREYMRLKPDGEFKIYDFDSYNGPQTEKPIIYIKPKESDYGIRITLQQTTGTFKSFDYNFLEEI